MVGERFYIVVLIADNRQSDNHRYYEQAVDNVEADSSTKSERSFVLELYKKMLSWRRMQSSVYCGNHQHSTLYIETVLTLQFTSLQVFLNSEDVPCL